MKLHYTFKNKPGYCLNCDARADDKYCAHCAQSTHTSRLDLKHFISHDIIHGVFHMDRGFPHTLLSILLRPGRVAWDYILGKRKRYYNFFYMLLILLGVMLYLNHLTTPEHLELQKGFTMKMGAGESVEFRPFLNQNLKYVFILFVPFFAIAGKIFLPRLCLNFIEHHLPAVVSVIGISVINSLLNIHVFLSEKFSTYGTVSDFLPIGLVFLFAMLLFAPYSYFQFMARGGYSIAGRIWRSLAIGVFFVLQVIIALAYLYVYLSGVI